MKRFGEFVAVVMVLIGTAIVGYGGYRMARPCACNPCQCLECDCEAFESCQCGKECHGQEKAN